MTGAQPGAGGGPEESARAHAARIVGRDSDARADLAAGAETVPPDLLESLLAHTFQGFELVAHARIGAHHVFKTKFLGPTTVVVQARWAADPGGRWRIREAEVARVEGGTAGSPRPVAPPGEV